MKYLMLISWRIFGIFLLFFLPFSAVEAKEQILIVPKCLLSDQLVYEELAKIKRLKLIAMQELEKLQIIAAKKPRSCGGFMNVTSAWHDALKQNQKEPQVFLHRYLREEGFSDLSKSNKIRYQVEVKNAISHRDQDQLEKYLRKLNAFPDRYAQSKSGVETAKWLSKTLKEFIQTSHYQEASVLTLPTRGAKQSSVLLKIGPDSSKEAIVIGAHMDTLPQFKNRAAHDEATGAATLLQVASALLKSGLQFKKTIYLIWYAAEKEGKLGSQTVVTHFNQNQIPVNAVLQLDMTGYVGKRGAAIGLTENGTDAVLTAFVADLINRYVGKESGVVQCGYACSDHVVWYQNGNRVAYPFETMDEVGNPYANTRKDTLDKLSLSHMMDFVKLSIAFAVELAEPIST